MFGFPIQQKDEDFKFSKNFLRTVIFQVKFPKIEDFAEKNAEIVEILKPAFANANAQVFQLSISEGAPVITQDNEGSGLLEFRDASNQKILNVLNDTLTLTIPGSAYTNFQQVQKDLEDSIYKILKHFKVVEVTRVAIRKINIISARASNPQSERKMSDMIRMAYNSNLAHSMLSFPASGSISTTVMNSKFIENDDSLNIIYGLLPKQDFEPDANHLLLDIDIFNESPTVTEEVRNRLKIINDSIFDVFTWCLQPSVISILSK